MQQSSVSIDSGKIQSVMPFRTPRRRISPRTKRRCRAIKEFFKKTLGTLSQTDYRTNSSIIVSVSDLKSKIDIIEQQLDKVHKHCHDLSCLENSLPRAESSTTQDNKQDGPSNNRLKNVETKIIYKSPGRDYIKSDESQYIGANYKWDTNKKSMNYIRNSTKHYSNQEYDDRPIHINKYFDRQVKQNGNASCLKISPEKEILYGNFKKVYSSVSLQSPKEGYLRNVPSCSRHHHGHKHHTKEMPEKVTRDYDDRDKLRKEFLGKVSTENHKSRKKKPRYSELDEAFIADIIRKQYKPVKLFGRRISDYSQFSAPVCRDQEFPMRNDFEEGSELCSCCFEGQRKVNHRHYRKYDVSDIRSICDARLYSSKRHRLTKQGYINDYNDSNLYDLVPVKEKSSPKSRRKFMEDNKQYEHCREVLPSPRTLRPRLNLKAQHYHYDDSMMPERQYRNSKRSKRLRNTEEIKEYCSDLSLHELKQRQFFNKEPLKQMRPQDGGTMSSLQYSTIYNEGLNVNNTTASTEDKTDRALCEIKDILQSFLQDIKKEPVHIHTSETSSKSMKHSEEQINEKSKSSTKPNNVQSNFSYYNSAAQCPPSFIPPFANPCCYPLLPICPVNCSPNGYIVPSQSYTCTTCANNSKATTCHKNDSTKTCKNHIENCPQDEMQELIKEIYKCVAQPGNNLRAKAFNHSSANKLNIEKTVLTSRSVGSSNASKHDAMVETQKMKCYSKSCEAIGSRMTTDTYYSTDPTYSDTVIEKLSLEVSHSSSDSELDKKSEIKKHKFSKVLRKFGLFKRKKKDIIEEVSESESTIEVNVKPKTKSPFNQHILNYNVHDQEFFHPPPHRHVCAGEEYGTRKTSCDMCKYRHHPQDFSPPQYYPPHVGAPPCCTHDHDPRYYNVPQVPQVPLCLKEIEVKSIGTQSERKLSIFPRFKKKIQSPDTQLHHQQNTITTQTPKETNIFLNWEKLKEKAKQNGNSNSDPIKFSLKTQKQLALGDMKMRNAMLKKLFYKRNPFSPRNLIVRTLLGKDKSSFGEPPKMYKPRMFI